MNNIDIIIITVLSSIIDSWNQNTNLAIYMFLKIQYTFANPHYYFNTSRMDDVHDVENIANMVGHNFHNLRIYLLFHQVLP